MTAKEFSDKVKNGEIKIHSTDPESREGECIECGQIREVCFPQVKQANGTFKTTKVIIGSCNH